MMKNKISKIHIHSKIKLNFIIIFSIFSIIIFLFYKGDIYITKILLNNQTNIVALYLEDPFAEEDTNMSEEIKTTEETSIQNVSYSEKNNIATQSIWHWPTTNNYAITTSYNSSHKAIDIYSFDGFNSNIYAANSGEVISVMGGCTIGDLLCNGKGGNYVIIKHNINNYYTVYMHLNKINVNIGDIVDSGEVIGTMGNTGNVIPIPTSTSPYNGTHLHFCLYIGKPYQGGYEINPMSLY